MGFWWYKKNINLKIITMEKEETALELILGVILVFSPIILLFL